MQIVLPRMAQFACNLYEIHDLPQDFNVKPGVFQKAGAEFFNLGMRETLGFHLETERKYKPSVKIKVVSECGY